MAGQKKGGNAGEAEEPDMVKPGPARSHAITVRVSDEEYRFIVAKGSEVDRTAVAP